MNRFLPLRGNTVSMSLFVVALRDAVPLMTFRLEANNRLSTALSVLYESFRQGPVSERAFR
jgi:hypothetical protein